MPPMFWRFVNGPWAAILSLCLGILGIPSMLDDAAAWSGWLAKTPPAVSLALLSVGSLLFIRYLYASRERVRDFTLKLLAAATAAQAAFRKQIGPPIRTAGWADLDSGKPTADANHETNEWEVIEHTIRRSSVVGGEAYPALVGMAKVKELRGDRHLYMYMFAHAEGSHMELRIESHHDPVGRRHAIVKVDGEVLSDMTFEPCLTATVSDTRRGDGIREEAAHLLNVGQMLTLSVTDAIPAPSHGDREHRHDILRVPLTGYRAANDRLSGIARSIWSASVHSYSPPEIAPSLDPNLLDRTMRSITEPSSYREWRRRMAERFANEDDDGNSTDQAD